MLRKTLGVLIGYGAWSIGWVGSSALLQSVMPGSFGEDGSIQSVGLLLVLLVIAMLLSLLAGWLASVIGRTGKGTALWTGIFLLVTGIGVQLQYWNLLPVWYHLCFLALLLPFTMVGGSLRAQTA